MTVNVSQSLPLKGRPGARLLVVLPVLACLLAAGLADVDALGYRRGPTLAGAWWRPLSAQLLHLGPGHLGVNLGAWLVLCALLLPRAGPRAIGAAALGGVLGTAAGLVLTPAIAWYVGLSGALHGVLAGGALAVAGRDRAAAGLLVLLVAKLAWETWVGPLPGERLADGARVVTEAHLWGALGGAVAGVIARLLAGTGARV